MTCSILVDDSWYMVHLLVVSFVSTLQEKLDGIRKRMDKVTSHQNYFQARESRHRHTSESNHSRVQWWSFIECSVIVGIGILQVFLIRSLFGSTRRDKIRT